MSKGLPDIPQEISKYLSQVQSLAEQHKWYIVIAGVVICLLTIFIILRSYA